MVETRSSTRPRTQVDFSDEPWKAPDATPFIRFEGVTRRFGDFAAVNDISLDIYKRELFCLLGASGCGKTTLLRMLAGFEQPSEGRILIDGRDMTAVPPYERPVNMMFQSYALFPHLSVCKNIIFGLQQDRISKAEMSARVEEVLDLLQLTPYARRKPHQLSGGQRQRVALARALVKRPKVLLLDEPLGALDKKLRERTQFELMNIQDEVGITFVVVTHDQDEAMILSSRIAVMDQGKIRQVGRPAEIYEYPNSRFTASFLGSVTIFEAQVHEVRDGQVVAQGDCKGLQLVASLRGQARLPEMGARMGFAVRPEKIMISKTAPDQEVNCLQGTVRDLAYLGGSTIYRVETAERQLVEVRHANLLHSAEREIDWDDAVWLSWSERAVVLLES